MGMNLVHQPAGIMPMALDANGIASGNAFLIGELERRDAEINNPLVSYTWSRDIYPELGGGYVQSTSNYYAEYATAGANQWGIISSAANNIPVLQANLSKDNFPVLPWSNIIKVPFLDQQYLATMGRSLDALLYDGLQINYNKMLDQLTYFGFPELGIYGLVNNPNIAAAFAATGAGSSKRFALKTPDEILADFNTLIIATWAASEYDLTGMANHILIPPTQFGYLATTKVSSAADKSILTYLLENNIAKQQGRDLYIVPARQCIGAGVPLTSGGAATDRMVAYVNDKKRLHMNIPVPLQRIMTAPDPNQLAYISPYLSLVGPAKFLYYQCAEYMDGI